LILRPIVNFVGRRYLKFEKLYERFAEIHIFPYLPTIDEDGLCTVHCSDFASDPLFKKCYDLGFATGGSLGWHLRWRVFIACWAVAQVKDLKGDFVECGVNTGMKALAQCNYIDFNSLDKKFFLLDTYSGVPEKYLDKESSTHAGYYAKDYYEVVKATFSGYRNVILIKGMIPDTLPLVTSETIAYLHIDCGVVEPEIASLDFFWKKMIPGGIVLLNCYNYSGFRNIKSAFDAYALEHGLNILALPTGQGLIVKNN